MNNCLGFLWQIKVLKKSELRNSYHTNLVIQRCSESNANRVSSAFEKHIHFRLLLHISKRLTVQMLPGM